MKFENNRAASKSCETLDLAKMRFGAALGLGFLALAAATLSGGAPATAQSMPMPQTGEMGEMGDMGGMMRPDAAAPVGIVGGMNPRKGRLMPSITYMHMDMEGNRDGTNSVSTSEVLAQFPVTPLSMEVDMLMAGLMYGVTDEISVMAMVPYVWRSMDHVTRMGTEFTTASEGIGDIRIIGGYDLYKGGGHSLEISAGLSLPTGSTDERDDTPAGSNQLLPYPMQIGSGTFDLLPGITYTGQSGDWSWGGQAGATIRLGENDEDYALGNVYGTSIWGARRWTDWVSSSVRLSGEITENIDGADSRLNPLIVPTADPDLRGGEVLSLGLGLNFLVPSGAAAGTRLSVEGVIPLVQDLDGPQVERDYMVQVSLRKAF